MIQPVTRSLSITQARQRLDGARLAAWDVELRATIGCTLELLRKLEFLSGFECVCEDLALCAAQFTLSLADIALTLGVKRMYGEPSAFKPYQEKLKAVDNFFVEQSKLPASTTHNNLIALTMPMISHRVAVLKDELQSSHDSSAKCLNHPPADGEAPFDLCEDGVKACGGFAEVRIGWWRPICHGIGQSTEQTRVAVKHIRARNIDLGTTDETGVQERLRKRINREIHSWKAVIGHRHILPFIGFSYSPEPFLVSPWCENGDMRAYLDGNPSVDRMQLLIQAADGFNFLHNQQPPIIHQDIKPDNILINSSKEAVISDFGLAKIKSEIPTGMTTEGVAMGTLLYMAPELHLDASAEGTPETDVYAFSLLILEILSKKRPFWNMKMHLLVAIMRGIQPKPDDHPDLPSRDVWSLLERGWHLEPSNRPSMAAVLSELQQRAYDAMPRDSATAPVASLTTLPSSSPESGESAQQIGATNRDSQRRHLDGNYKDAGPSNDHRTSRRSKFACLESTTIEMWPKQSHNTVLGRRTSSVASGRLSKRQRLAHVQPLSPPPSTNQDSINSIASLQPDPLTSVAALSYGPAADQQHVMPASHSASVPHFDRSPTLTPVQGVDLEAPVNSSQDSASSHDYGTQKIDNISVPKDPLERLPIPSKISLPPLPSRSSSSVECQVGLLMTAEQECVEGPSMLDTAVSRSSSSLAQASSGHAGDRDKTIEEYLHNMEGLNDDFNIDLKGATPSAAPLSTPSLPTGDQRHGSSGSMKGLKRSMLGKRSSRGATKARSANPLSESSAPSSYMERGPPPGLPIRQSFRPPVDVGFETFQKTRGVSRSDLLLEVSKGDSVARGQDKGKEAHAPVAHHPHHSQHHQLQQFFESLLSNRRNSSVPNEVADQKLAPAQDRQPSQQLQGALTWETITKIRCVHFGETSDVWHAEYCPNSSTPTPIRVAVRYLRRLRTQEISAFSSALSSLVQRWATWDHPHIMSLLDHGLAPDSRTVTPWYEMGSLSKQPSSLSTNDRNRLLLQIADGLVYLHTNPAGPVVHGNIKPGNIYLDDCGNAKIGGFESSLATVDNHQHVINSVVQDVRYKAPELLEADQPSTASDIYALALVGVELLSGKRPFDTLQASHLAAAIASGLTPSMADHPDLSGRCTTLWPIFEQMWDRDPLCRLGGLQVVRLLDA